MTISPHSAEGVQFLAWLEALEQKKLLACARPDKLDRDTQYLRGQIKGLRMVADHIRGDKEPDDTAG